MNMKEVGPAKDQIEGVAREINPFVLIVKENPDLFKDLKTPQNLMNITRQWIRVTADMYGEVLFDRSIKERSFAADVSEHFGCDPSVVMQGVSLGREIYARLEKAYPGADHDGDIREARRIARLKAMEYHLGDFEEDQRVGAAFGIEAGVIFPQQRIEDPEFLRNQGINPFS